MIHESFGSRARVATLLGLVHDAQGNRDGIIGNEDRPARALDGRTPPANPVAFAATRALSVGWSKRDEERKLTAFLTSVEQRMGAVTDLDRPRHVASADWAAFRLAKAATLVRFDRTPTDVRDSIVRASGDVDGQPIADRDLFTQHIAARPPLRGTTVVMAPGFLETGRSYLEQAMLLSDAGYDVVVFDQQWAGLSQGDRGGIDRGFGVARDVAAVAADAAAKTPSNRVVLIGTSMGGGPGAYGAVHMNADGRIHLAGPEMPRDVGVVLCSPYFATTRSLVNDALSANGRIPGLRKIALPALGLPILSTDPVTLKKIAAHATSERISGQASAFHAPTADLAAMYEELEAGRGPNNPICIVQGTGDTLADYPTTQRWEALMPNARLMDVASRNHVMEENPKEQALVLEALAWVEARGCHI